MQSPDKKNQSSDPIDSKADVRNNPDPKIDQDFKGFPDGEGSEEKVNPKTATDKKTAAVDTKDGEKKLDADKKKADTDELRSDGSANAFEGSELKPKDDSGGKGTGY